MWEICELTRLNIELALHGKWAVSVADQLTACLIAVPRSPSKEDTVSEK